MELNRQVKLRAKGTSPRKQPRRWLKGKRAQMPGVTQRGSERCLYLALKPGETAEGQQDDVYKHWSALYKRWRRSRAGERLGGLHGPTVLLTLPDEESFGDFTVSRYPSSVGETEEKLMPVLGEGLELLREVARATGRWSASIESGMAFATDDGRRVRLSECAYRKLRTDADYRVKAKPRRNHAPKASRR